MLYEARNIGLPFFLNNGLDVYKRQLFEVAEKGVDFIYEMEMTAEEAFQSLAPKIGRPNEDVYKRQVW